MGQAIGLYFRGLDKEGVNALRARLNRLAGTFGYVAQAGPTTGEGNLAALLIAIGDGEIVLVRHDPETGNTKAIGLEGKLDGDDMVDMLQPLAIIKVLR